jgi:cytochrome b6-f complex iron-sulfur subunit
VKDCNDVVDCSGRREFIVKSAMLAGGLVLTLSGAGSGFAAPFEDVTIAIDDKSPLNKVGGSATVESSAGKIVVARTGDTTFVAVAAKCTHKGGPIKYDSDAKQFLCPWHGSKYGTDGSNKGGPSDSPLASYKATGSATSVTVKVGS